MSGSRIIYPTAITAAGAANFTLSVTPAYSFLDAVPILGANQYILLRSWFYYAPGSATHDFSLWQAPAAAAAAVSTWGVLNISTGITNAQSTCPTEILKTSAGVSWVLMALTANGKSADGTLTISYSVETR